MEDYIESLKGKSSLFKILVEPGSKVYRYDVSIKQIIPGKRDTFITKQSDPHCRNADTLTCRAIIKLAHQNSHGFGTGLLEHDYCYDGKATFYSLHKLSINEVKLAAKKVNDEELDIKVKSNATLVVSIQQNAQKPELDYSNFKEALLNLDSYTADHSVRTFLEIVTSEFLILSGHYQHCQSGAVYHTQPKLRDPIAIRNPGIQVFEGLKKGVRIVDEKTAWLVVDICRSTFYATADHQGNTVSLAEVYKQFVRNDRDEQGRRRFEKHFNGVRMIVSYDTSRTIPVFSLSRNPVNNQQYYVDGRSISDFYRDTYDIDLQYPYLLGIHTSSDGMRNNVIYPMEVLNILPGQCIPREKILPDFENIIPPAERYHLITKQIELFCTGHGEQFLRKFGISIQDSSNDVTIHSRALPRVRVKNNFIKPPLNGFFLKEMKRVKFLQAPNCLKNWVVVFDERIQQRRIEQFVEALRSTLNGFGVVLGKPNAFLPVILERLEELFIACKEERNYQDFILFIDNKGNESHGLLKLLEAKYKLLTQHVTMETVEIAQKTLQGISMKLNSKCYGLNFLPEFKPYMSDLDLEKNPDLLVIGYDVAHPSNAPPREKAALRQKGYGNCSSFHPSVVGIGANKNEHLCTFSADFFYQEARREELSSHRLQKAICEIIECCFNSSQRIGKVRKPTRLVIIRDGISEGQYKMAMERELQAIYKGYAEGMSSIGDDELAKKRPKITFLIATKRHHKRFFRLKNGKICNTMPGDVINEKVVRTDVINETFFQTHHAIKGTAHLTQYTVLQNDLQILMPKIQEFMLMLSFMHQVSACPTSLPLPVYLADETAKRGMEIYQEWDKLQMASRRGGAGDQRPALINDPPKSDDLTTRFDELTEEFHYGHSALADTRYNS